MNITPEQSRAARCYLDWTRADLEKASGISRDTIKNFETGKYLALSSTKEALLRTFEAEGLVLIDDGVKRKSVCPSCGYPATPAREQHEPASTPQV